MAASITLILRRRILLKLILISIVLSLVSFLDRCEMVNKFSGGISGISILIFFYGYSYWLNKRGYLYSGLYGFSILYTCLMATT